MVSIVFFYACKRNQIAPDNIYKFRGYISHTTSGIVSSESAVEIHFVRPLDQQMDQGPLPSDLLKISPKAEGILLKKDNYTLEFKPNDRLESDTEYSLTLNLDKLFKGVPEEQKTYTFQFKTIKPYYKVSIYNLQSYSKDWQFLEGSVQTSDVVSLENAKKLVKARTESQGLKLVWDASYEKAKLFHFKIDSIERKENLHKIRVSWKGKAIKSDIEGEEMVRIPGKNNFKVMNVAVVNNTQQYISVNFSDPIQKGQNFNGLIQISGVSKPTYVVDGNVLKVFADRRLSDTREIEVFTGLKNSDGYQLRESFKQSLTFKELKPSIRLVNSGNILPNSNNLKFSFEAVNLRAVDVRVIKIFENNVLQFLQRNHLNGSSKLKRVGRRVAKETISLIEDATQNTKTWRAYSIDLSKMFKAEPGAIYRVELSIKRAYSLYGCKNNVVSDDKDIRERQTEEEREEKYWDNKLYSYRNHSYNWRQRKNPCYDSYYNDIIVAQNLLASNIGIIVKKGNRKNYFFAVNDIITAQPISGAKIKLYNYQQQQFQQLVTNSEGIATYNSDKEAHFATVTKLGNTSYIKLNDGSALSLSKFDVSGVKTQKGIKGYLYGERGVWRPGALYI